VGRSTTKPKQAAARNSGRTTRPGIVRAPKQPVLTQEQQEIWEKAAAFCVRNLPTLWAAGEPRQQAPQEWIVPIVLRYPDGYEGTLGELAWDGVRQAFTLLTKKTILSGRARLVAASRPLVSHLVAPSQNTVYAQRQGPRAHQGESNTTGKHAPSEEGW
jgi:hypothetical protein